MLDTAAGVDWPSVILTRNLTCEKAAIKLLWVHNLYPQICYLLIFHHDTGLKTKLIFTHIV